MNEKREPKGSRTGGQFAPNVNAESTVALDDSPKVEFEYELSPEGDPDEKHDRRFFNCDVCGEVCFGEECEMCGATTRSLSGQTARDIGLLDDEPSDDYESDLRVENEAPPLTAAERTELGMPPVTGPTITELEASITSIEAEIKELEQSLRDASLDEAIDDISDYEESLLSGNRRLVGKQSDLIAALRMDRKKNPSLNEIVLSRALDRISEPASLYHDESAADEPSTLTDEFHQYGHGEHGPDYDDAFEGIDYVVDRFLDWRLEQKEAQT